MTTRDQLEAAIDAHPDQADNYLVLGDWLQEQQDPRGELIGLHRAKGIERTEDAKARISVLQRELGPQPPRYGTWSWFYGYVQYLRDIIDEDDEALVRATLDHPSLRHLVTVELDLAGGEYDERQWLVDLIARRRRPCWRSLSINSYWRGGNEPPAGELDVSSLWNALPRIQCLRVAARFVTLGDVRAESLTELSLDGQVAAEQLATLLGGAPNLNELELYDIDVERFADVLEAAPAMPLTKLVLPFPNEKIQQRILARYPCADFSATDGERYEQTGE